MQAAAGSKLVFLLVVGRSDSGPDLLEITQGGELGCFYPVGPSSFRPHLFA